MAGGIVSDPVSSVRSDRYGDRGGKTTGRAEYYHNAASSGTRSSRSFWTSFIASEALRQSIA